MFEPFEDKNIAETAILNLILRRISELKDCCETVLMEPVNIAAGSKEDLVTCVNGRLQQIKEEVNSLYMDFVPYINDKLKVIEAVKEENKKLKKENAELHAQISQSERDPDPKSEPVAIEPLVEEVKKLNESNARLVEQVGSLSFGFDELQNQIETATQPIGDLLAELQGCEGAIRTAKSMKSKKMEDKRSSIL